MSAEANGRRNNPVVASPQTVDQFNGLMDAIYGSWSTCWVYSDEYGFAFWRDIYDSVNYCSNLYRALRADDVCLSCGREFLNERCGNVGR